MRYGEHSGWSFGNRPFWTAVAVSILWHAFWFFSITIVVSPSGKVQGAKPRLVSLGPVLGDDIFRALVESRVETTPAYYRPRLTRPAEDLPVETAERRTPQGGVVSVPFGSKAQSALENLVGGTKASPDFDIADIFGSTGPLSKKTGSWTGPASERQILFAPPRPAAPLLSDPAGLHAVTRIRFQVDSSGSVASAEISSASGYPQLDLIWLEYLRRFQFVPQASGAQDGASEAEFSFSEGASGHV